MNQSSLKAKLTWNCRRGMLELDLILSDFLLKDFHSLNTDQLNNFATLLDMPDPELYAYLIGQAEPATTELIDIVYLIRFGHHTN